jgi:hypothetical protein
LQLTLCVGASAQDEPASQQPAIVRPTDRLAWREAIATAAAGAYLFRAYVDDVPAFLDAACAPAADDGDAYDCSAPLPPLTPGRHRIEVSALASNDGGIEGERSDPIFVELPTSTLSMPVSGMIGDIRAAAPDRVIAGGLEDPVDIAIVRDGLVVIAERRGRILGVSINEAVAAVEVWATTTDRDHELLSVAAVDAKYLFAVYRAGVSASLVRYALSSRGLTDRSIMLDELPAGNGAAVLRQGPDGMLYLALGAAPGDGEERADVGSWRGKVLRLNKDGSLPRDTPSVAFAPSAYEPRDLVWRGVQPWMLSATESGVVTLMPLRSFWTHGETTSAGMTLPQSFGARSVLATSDGNLLVSGTSSSMTMRIAAVDGRVTVAAPEFNAVPIIRRAADLRFVFICTEKALVIQPQKSP